MPGYAVVDLCHPVAGFDWRMRQLQDRQQFDDPDGVAERAGVSSAQWPLFGILWPSAVMLARRLARRDLRGLRVLELGCGLGLPSLVAAAGGADVTCVDVHPLAGEFLVHNAHANGLAAVRFVQHDWLHDTEALDTYDLICGSDLLYEPKQGLRLAAVFGQHAQVDASAFLVDPARGQHSRFRASMRAAGFSDACDTCDDDTSAGVFRGTVSEHHRGRNGPTAPTG